MSHYSSITSAQITEGTDQALAEAQTVLDDVVAPKQERTFQNTLRPLDRISDILGHASANFFFMGYVHTDKEVRQAGKTAEEKATKWGAEIYFRMI